MFELSNGVLLDLRNDGAYKTGSENIIYDELIAEGCRGLSHAAK